MSQKNINIWMPLYIGDFLRDTAGMTTESIGAVVLLYLAIWSKGGPLPDDNQTLAIICHMPADRFAQIRDNLSELFEIEDAHWTRRELLVEHAKWKEQRRRKSESGRSAANIKWNKKSEDKIDPPGLPDDVDS